MQIYGNFEGFWNLITSALFGLVNLMTSVKSPYSLKGAELPNHFSSDVGSFFQNCSIWFNVGLGCQSFAGHGMVNGGFDVHFEQLDAFDHGENQQRHSL